MAIGLTDHVWTAALSFQTVFLIQPRVRSKIPILVTKMRMLFLALVLYVSSFHMARADLLTTNLLLNPGAEDGTTTNWVVGGVSNPSADNGSFDTGINPHSGSYDFYGHTGAWGTLSQTVFLPGNDGITPGLIDAGLLLAYVSFWEKGLNQGTPSDEARIDISFLDGSTNLISTNSTPFIDSHDGAWSNYSALYAVPVATRLITYTMYFFRNVGSDNDSFVDDNMLAIQFPGLSIFPDSPGVIISWPSAYSNYVLQQTPVLPAANWVLNTNPVSLLNSSNLVTSSPATNNMFFRLAPATSGF